MPEECASSPHSGQISQDIVDIREDGQLLRALTLDSNRRYVGAATPVHNVVRQVSSMS